MALRIVGGFGVTDGEWVEWCKELLATHSPTSQLHGYERCEHCHYTRHPCDVFELAAELLKRVEFGGRVVEELNKHGWGDFHYGTTPQEPQIVALVEEWKRMQE